MDADDAIDVSVSFPMPRSLSASLYVSIISHPAFARRLTLAQLALEVLLSIPTPNRRKRDQP